MKILIITDYHNKTGSGKQNYQLYTELRSMWHEAEMFNLVSPQGFWEEPEFGINSTAKNFLFGVFWKFRRDLATHLSTNHYDIILLWQHGLSYLYGTLKQSGQTSVLSLADLFPLNWNFTPWWDVRYWIYNAFMLRPFRQFDNVVFNSEYTKNSYLEKTGRLPKMQAVIHIGTHFPSERLKIESGGPSRDWNAEFQGKPVVLQVGSIDKRKNANLFFRLAKASREKHGAKYEFVRVWKFPKDLDPSFEAFVQRYQRLSESDLIWLYSYAKAFVLASYAEWFGVPIVEARSIGLPVVSTKISDMAQICENDAGTRFVNDPDDEMEYLKHVEHFLEGTHNPIPFPFPEKLTVETETQKYLEFFQTISR